MLSNVSRLLTYTCALLYGVMGVFLFAMPEQLAPIFAWNVTAFMAMTIGGWCLGNAWLAYITARRWEWKLVYSSLFYLWMFGVGELTVLLSFRDKLVLAHPIAVLYVVTLAVNGITALVGLADLIRLRPSSNAGGPQKTRAQTAGVWAFVIFVGFLGIYGLTAASGAPGTNAGIFPEVMTPLTLRSFGTFYLVLALAVLPHLWEKNLNTILHHSLASYGLILFILLAAFVYISLFDFAARPGGLLYFFVYFLVGIPLLFAFRKLGTGTR